MYHTGHDFAESVLYIKRVSKVVTGGRVFSCTAYVAVGNGECSIGVGLGKASEVSEAIRKASRKAAKNMIYIPNRKNITVTNDISVKYNATILNLKSAKAGTGLLCCDVAKKIFELANLKDVVLKIHGSSNKRNVICGMIKLFKNLESIRRISQRTGKTIEYLIERRKELKNATSR
ncbi:hypothetical protein AB836_01825 [Rickettsiales bacterium (ex Bugula neritina AB1)]|nr:hypothetical protein AB836_01825 [Rickettsiales bacterium (ex Bugula neritina AB1)]